MPQDVVPSVTAETDPARASDTPPWRPELPWLEPYPDNLLDEVPAASESEPDAEAISRETIELTFLAALQHLPPRQRAVLILSDVLDWPAKEIAGLLELTVAAVNSALQRARSTMRTQLPPVRHEWSAASPRSERERSVLDSFMAAWERADAAMLTELLREDARWTMPPAALWFQGRAAIARMFELYPIDWQGRDFRMLPTAANRQVAAAAYVRANGESEYRLVSIHVLRIEEGQIAEVTAFAPSLCGAFQLPETLPAT